MPDLIASMPLAERSVQRGAATLSALPLAPLFWIAPYPGQLEAVDAALRAALGLGWPQPGTCQTAQDGEIRWAGRAQAMLLAAAAPDLAQCAAVTEVWDVYARFHVGPADAAAEVLARLVPLDLRPARFQPGQTARSLLGHISAQFSRTETGVEVMVMRSFAQTAFHEIETAMQGVSGRAALA
ncbi:MAG: sarcosine oxidase subunit gamma [Pseudomonadota bacterium]